MSIPRLSFLLIALSLVLGAGTPIPPAEPVPQGSAPSLPEDVLRETYRGICSGSITDSRGDEIQCPEERPVCYSDGSCSCEPDKACETVESKDD
jgi:hypothetical protein